MGATASAITLWPDVLPDGLTDRVVAAGAFRCRRASIAYVSQCADVLGRCASLTVRLKAWTAARCAFGESRPPARARHPRHAAVAAQAVRARAYCSGRLVDLRADAMRAKPCILVCGVPELQNGGVSARERQARRWRAIRWLRQSTTRRKKARPAGVFFHTFFIPTAKTTHGS